MIGFNRERQKELFGMLGIENITTSDLVMWLVVLISWWIINREPAQRKDLIKVHYDRLCRKLEKSGVMHRSNEGAGEFLARVVEVLPHRRRELAMITSDYENLRYGKDASERRLRRYIRAVRRFRVR